MLTKEGSDFEMSIANLTKEQAKIALECVLHAEFIHKDPRVYSFVMDLVEISITGFPREKRVR